MSTISTRYPVDLYLVESSKKLEMVNIIDDDLWNIDPALKPEDELTLRKLHEMLQSTADDLKLLSGELSKFHQPGVQIKTTPVPLDEEFNEKVHIEEIVNAKFHGYKIIDKSSSCLPDCKTKNDGTNEVRPTTTTQKPKINNTNVMKNTAPLHKKLLKRNLGITRTNIIQVNGNQDSFKIEKLNNGKVINAPAVAYKEYTFKYVQPKLNNQRKYLQVQEMPRINIRSEFKEQKVLQLDILPDYKVSEQFNTITNNTAVITLQHETPGPVPARSSTTVESFKPVQHCQTIRPTIRKISKMSTCESSGSVNNTSSDTQMKLKTQKRLLTTIRSPQTSIRNERKKLNIKKDTGKRQRLNLESWRKKLNVVYGSSSIKKNTPIEKMESKFSPKNTNTFQRPFKKQSVLNNAEYIPYSKLTVGGARVSDLEKELSEMPNKKNIPLNPIIDKILSSHENSRGKGSPRKPIVSDNHKILSTSDENLLQEVIDIERTVSETISRNNKKSSSARKPQNVSSDTEEDKGNENYVDDFDDENSNHSSQSDQSTNRESSEGINDDENKNSSDNNKVEEEQAQNIPRPNFSEENACDLTYTKTLNLSLKNKIDVFEYVPAVGTLDSTTQSNDRRIIFPKETQTSPRNDNNVQPIHNDLWSSMDPNGRVEKMFELEKEFIKKFILDEYGDLLEKDIVKPSTSKAIEATKNVAALQKNTQTSPAHVKNVMTSPTKTKTRTTSPFTKLTVDNHTNPLIFVSNEDDVKVEIEDEDLDISINLSSPRFSLRLPQNCQEVLSNMGGIKRIKMKNPEVTRTCGWRSKITKNTDHNITTSSSSVEADSSEISSLGEIRLRRMMNKMKINADCESVCSTSSKYSSELQSEVLPLRSEGEMSLGLNKKSKRHYKSEGETSFGFL